jgi:hypothetical protein
MKPVHFARGQLPGPPHFGYNKRGILRPLFNRLNTGLSFDPSTASRNQEHDHGDNDAEGFGERPATARARRDDTERSSRHRRIAE